MSLHRDKRVTLTLEQIEMLLGCQLPRSARVYHAWWKDEFSHPNVKSWSSVGWEANVHSDKGKIAWVTFKKLTK